MAEENKPDDDLKLREENDGSVTVGDPQPSHPDDEPEDDPKPSQSTDSDNDDDGESGDEHGDDTETDAERQARTERNRMRRQASKEHRKEKFESLKRELAARDRIINELHQRVAVVERRSSGSEMAQLDKSEQDAIQAYNYFKQVHSKAVAQADGDVATDAAEKMAIARQNVERIQSIKKNFSKQQNAPQPLDPRLASHASQWMSKNTWYNPEGGNEDSEIALVIDRRLANEGWDPTTPEYWEELDKRVKKRLPHRSERGTISPTNSGKRPPVSGSGRESSSGNSQGTYKISAERVQALKDADLWDDPKKRADAIRRFQEYDKENRA